MTREEYENYIEALKARGYKFGGSWYNRPYYYKVIEYREDEDGNRRPVCLILFNLCEMEDECSGNAYYSIEPTVTVRRNTDERLNLTNIRPKRSIEECERIAKEFLRFVDNNINEYQENGE